MISVKGVYKDGRIELLEPLPALGTFNVIVTVLDEPAVLEKRIAPDAFDDLVGAVSSREDGAERHDEYLCEDARR
jgi:hypothetical protein